MEENLKNIKTPPNKKTSILKAYPFLRRFSVDPKYRLVISVLVLAIGMILSVYLANKSTNYKSGAQTVDIVKQDNQKLKNLIGTANPAEIAILASQRKELMLKLSKSDPKAFLEGVLDQDTFSKLPQLAKDQIEKKQTIEGTASLMTVQTETADDSYYFVDDDKTKKRFYLTFNSKIPDITTGSKVKAETYTLDDRAVGLTGDSSVQITSQTLGAAVGPFTRNVLAIRVLLSDNTSQGYTNTETLGVLFNYSYSAKAFHKESSFGIVNYTGTITPYLKVPYSTADACGNYGGPITTAINNAATAAGYNLSSYQNLVYLFPKTTASCPVAVGSIGASPSTTYQQRVWYFGNRYSSTSNASILAHELGHNLGMHHADTLKCGSKAIDAYSSCTVAEYGDKYDTIGYQYTYYPQDNGPHKYLLGYFAPSNVINVTQSGTYTIVPNESNTASPQTIRIKKSTGDYYFLEYRRPLGAFDNDLPSSVISGASLYIGGSNIIENGGDRKTYLLDTTPGDTTGFGNASFVDGRAFSDPASFLTIKQLSHTASSVTLSITYAPPTPTFTPTPTPKPTFTPTPSSKPTATPTITPIPDNTPPTISITAPLDGSFITKNSNVTITAVATDNIGVSKVDFFLNGNQRCTDSSSPYNCGFRANGKTGSTFTIKAIAYDKSNNTSAATVTITSN